MVPQRNVPLCGGCIDYLSSFQLVHAHKIRRLKRCGSCGSIGLHRVCDLEQKLQRYAFVDTLEGWALAAHCAPELWKRAQTAFHTLPDAVQMDLMRTPQTERDFERRGKIWAALLGQCLDERGVEACRRVIRRQYSHLRERSTVDKAVKCHSNGL